MRLRRLGFSVLYCVAVLSTSPIPCRAWPSDTLTQVQVSPASAIDYQGARLGVGAGSIFFWQTNEGPGVSRLRGLDLDGVPDQAWPDSGLLLETDTRPAQDEILLQGSDGSVIVLWMFGGLDSLGAFESKIRAQRFRAGQRLWGPNGVVVSRQSQSGPYIVRAIQDDRGGVVVAWGTRENFPEQRDCYLARLDSNGVHRWASDIAVCEAAGGQGPTQLLLRHDDVQVFWVDSRVTDEPAIYTQKFDSSGTALLQTDGVRILGARDSGIGHVLADPEGGTYLTYGTPHPGSALIDLYLCRIDSVGSTHAGWPASGVEILASPILVESSAGLTMDASGHVIVAWGDQRYAGIHNSTGAIWLQRFSPAGTRMWTEDRLGIAGRGSNPQGGYAIPDGSGGYYLSYSNHRAATGNPTVIRVQHVDANATPLWRPEAVTVAAANSRKFGPSILPDGSGGLFVAWLDNRFGDDNQAIFAQHVNADGTLGGSVTATQASAIESRYEGGCAHLAWHTSESAGIRFDVERSRTGEAYERIGEAFPDGAGRVAWRDCDWDGASSQRYRLSWLEAGERAHSAPVEVLAVPTGGNALSPPSPMPMNGVAEVAFTLARSGHVRLALYDLAGREVARLLDDPRAAGTHRLAWHAHDREGRALAPGAYVLTLRSGAEVRSQRVVVLR